MIDDWFVSCTFTFECWIIDSIEGANANQNEMVMLEMQKQQRQIEEKNVGKKTFKPKQIEPMNKKPNEHK